MESKNEEDFWNTSSNATFNFDDDEDSSLFESSDYVFNPITEESNILPIHTLISKECLSIILDDVKSTVEYVVPPVEETIKKMFHGQRFILYFYRTLDDKLLLLDAAINTADVRHYANYLITKGKLEELADLYMITGNPASVKDIYYLISGDSKQKSSLIKRLEQFLIEHSSTFNWMEDLHDHLSFLRWQINRKENCNCVIEQLAVLCKKEWDQNKADDDIQEYKKQFKIDDFQYEWTTMQVLCRMGLWKKLISTFIKPSNWLTKKALKSVINPEVFLLAVSKHHPPSDALNQFVQCVGEGERSLYLAQKLQAHKFVINYYINQKDRTSLLNYRETVGLKPEEILLINNALQASDKKWKN